MKGGAAARPHVTRTLYSLFGAFFPFPRGVSRPPKRGFTYKHIRKE